MPLQSSGQISLFNIGDQFGPAGHSNIALRNYLAGGTYVPSGTTNSSNAQIPSSGQLSIQNFYGAPNSGPVAPATPRTWGTTVNWEGSTTSANTWVKINNDGTINCMRGDAPNGTFNGHSFDDTFYNPTGAGAGDNVYVFATLLSGAVGGSNSNIFGQWLSMGGGITRSWGVQAQTTNNTQTVTQTASVRIDWSTTASSSGLLFSSTYNMTATVNGTA